MQQSTWAKALSGQERLFVSLADGVSHTMLQLARLSEQAGSTPRGTQAERWQIVRDLSEASLQLLEGYTLTMRLQGGVAQPELEPLTVGSLLTETKRLLEPYARQLSVQLALDVAHGLEPIISDRSIVQSALLSLGQVMVTAQAQSDAAERTVYLGAHKGRYGVVAGWYCQNLPLSADALRRARKLQGQAQQPYSQLVGGPASGVFIAESLLHTVSTKLHVARYHNATGLAATLPLCNQLQLV
ncbi:hypothetical protein JNM87_05225 [Candidatus Saccharibacteria bacterium]|nr:hypothetical protein [Candidatus Saccharibacteria bacterium]